MKPCLIFKGCQGTDGYGLVKRNGKMQRAHRLAWERIHGPIPKGMLVCHRCDNRACVNPEHLFLGTQKDNIQDAIAKQRMTGPRGEKQGLHKLTVDQVIEIRRMVGTQTEIAAAFGIGQDHVSRIRSKKVWKWL